MLGCGMPSCIMPGPCMAMYGLKYPGIPMDGAECEDCCTCKCAGTCAYMTHRHHTVIPAVLRSQADLAGFLRQFMNRATEVAGACLSFAKLLANTGTLW